LMFKTNVSMRSAHSWLDSKDFCTFFIRVISL
jgi:hypothetical protein